MLSVLNKNTGLMVDSDHQTALCMEMNEGSKHENQEENLNPQKRTEIKRTLCCIMLSVSGQRRWYRKESERESNRRRRDSETLKARDEKPDSAYRRTWP